MNIFKKKWSRVDLTCIVGIIFSFMNLILAWRDGEFFLKGITVNKNLNPGAFWLVFFVIFCIAVTLSIIVLTKDFSGFDKKEGMK